MARDHPEEKKEETQFVEREINLTLINAKINENTNLLVEIAKKVGVDMDKD